MAQYMYYNTGSGDVRIKNIIYDGGVYHRVIYKTGDAASQQTTYTIATDYYTGSAFPYSSSISRRSTSGTVYATASYYNHTHRIIYDGVLQPITYDTGAAYSYISKGQTYCDSTNLFSTNGYTWTYSNGQYSATRGGSGERKQETIIYSQTFGENNAIYSGSDYGTYPTHVSSNSNTKTISFTVDVDEVPQNIKNYVTDFDNSYGGARSTYYSVTSKPTDYLTHGIL